MEDDNNGDWLCGRQELGGHLLKLPILLFQVLLCMKLEVQALITSANVVSSEV
jgi:hypothetical protein